MLQTTYVRRSKDAPFFIENFRPGHYFEEEIFFRNQKKKPVCVTLTKRTVQQQFLPPRLYIYIYKHLFLGGM